MDRTENLAVLIPCLNEEESIFQVVTSFQISLPQAQIFVYDNGSSDSTYERALEAGASVRMHPQIGKGNVLRRMFAEIDADYYIIIDGDNTYDPADAPSLLKKLQEENLDMVVGRRKSEIGSPRHATGNKLFNWLYRKLFGNGFSDIFSGYRILSRRFVKSFPAASAGFEVETEISVHASQLRLPSAEVDVSYKERSLGSYSKLRTIPDGYKVLRSMLLLLKDNRQMLLFGVLSSCFFAASLALGIPIFLDFIDTGLVERLPTTVLATGLSLISLIQLVLGLLLDSVARGRIEMKRLAYLQTF